MSKGKKKDHKKDKKIKHQKAAKVMGTSPANPAMKAISDLVKFGNPDLWQLVCKASSQSGDWMKSTKVMEIPDLGVVIQATTQQGKHVAEALQFVPGAKLAGPEDNRYLVAIGYDVAASAAPSDNLLRGPFYARTMGKNAKVAMMQFTGDVEAANTWVDEVSDEDQSVIVRENGVAYLVSSLTSDESRDDADVNIGDLLVVDKFNAVSVVPELEAVRKYNLHPKAIEPILDTEL